MSEGAHILIVEDEPMLREAFRLMLEDAGYRVSEAGTGGDALARVAADPPNLVLLDLGLPDMGGLDVARDLKSKPETQDIVVVALTGRVGAAEKQACIDAGCKVYLPKPFSPRELLRRLPELLA